MRSWQIVQRIILSVFLIGLAVSLSGTQPAIEAHQLSTPSPIVQVSKRLPNHFTPVFPTTVDSKTSFACVGCELPPSNPTLTLILLAALTDLVVMAGLIYGCGFLASWAIS